MPSVHDPMFNLPAKPPFRWGMSPFRARGVVYNEEIAVAQKVLDGKAMEAVRRAGDPALEAFLMQRFSSLEWYDTAPIVYFGYQVARLRGVPLNQHIRDVSLAHASRALSGFSGTVLKLISTEAVATWLPRASAWYHDFGGAESKVVGDGHVRATRWGMPHFLVHGWSLSAMYFTEEVLTRSGARKPRASTLEVESDGMKEGHPTYRIGFDVTWEP